VSTLDLKPGDAYVGYEIRAQLGQGAFGSVYRAWSPMLEREVAMKVSLRPVGTSEASDRALREIAILRALTNTHVVRVHDAGQGPDGRVFIVMDLLEGESLERAHDFDSPMAPGQALWVIHQACLGLAEAHAHGIVHRDVKPENIWVEPDHNVRVIDFGLARAWDTEGSIGTDVTVGRMLVGTPHYMPPEQLYTQKLAPASDVYALCTVLYELLTGRCVYFPDRPVSAVREQLRDDPVGWLNAHRSAQIVPLAHYPHCRDLPRTLVDLVEQCLDKLPECRPADAGRLANAIGRILHYELGVALGATLRVTHPYGGYEDHLLLPGSHRIGSGSDVEFQLRDGNIKRVHAVLEWAGLPEYPQLRPLVGDGSITVNGAKVTRRVELSREDAFAIGPFAITLWYPEL
jgi:serine/threonine-protein kinase